MKHIYKKNIRVMNDVLGHCYRCLGARDFHMDMSLGPQRSVLTIQAEVAAVDPEDLRLIDDYLNIPRQREVEQNYWNLSGNDEADGELQLAGMMVDRAYVRHEDGLLSIVMFRENDPGDDW